MADNNGIAPKKNNVKVTLTIRHGPMTPAQKTAWRKFWQKIIAEVKADEGNH